MVANRSDLFLLSDGQTARLESFVTKSHGKLGVDDMRAPSGIVFVDRGNLLWRDAPR